MPGRTVAALFVTLLLVACVESVTSIAPPPPAPASAAAPPPPPGDHDQSFVGLPRPFSIANAKRVLLEATVFAPWGIGLGGRPLQALALNAVLEQANAREILADVYDQAAPAGRLLALCGLQTVDGERFTSLSATLQDSSIEVVRYEGCLAEHRTVAELVVEISATSICTDIPRSKERIVAMCERAG